MNGFADVIVNSILLPFCFAQEISVLGLDCADVHKGRQNEKMHAKNKKTTFFIILIFNATNIAKNMRGANYTANSNHGSVISLFQKP